MSPADMAASTITPDDMYDRIAFIASDEMGGRDTPSPGLEKTASYIADQFRSFGLTPAGDSGTFIQRWSYRTSTMDVSRTVLRAEVGSSSVVAKIGSEFFVIPAASTTNATAGMVYAGTAGQTRALGADAKGRFAAFFVPGAELDMNWQSGVQSAMLASQSAGVAGIVLILDPAFDAGMISQLSAALGSQQAPLFVIGLRHDKAKEILTADGQDLDALRGSSPASAVTLPNTRLSVSVYRSSSESRPPNVVAVLLGSDPVLRDQYVVFSAHMDHVGFGPSNEEGDSIFNGADDDASGTATVLEVAQAFASLPTRPKRSLIFLTVSGEEKGLFGSAWFTEHPPVAKDKIIANINLDMVGRNHPDTVVAIGQDYSSLGPTAQRVARQRPELHLVVAPDLWPQENLFFRSDHFNFARAGIPAIFFTTGLHEQYHKQSDEAELIDKDKITRIGRLVFHLAHDIANAAEAPTWTEAGRAAVKAAGGN
jgi:hypothetical protein